MNETNKAHHPVIDTSEVKKIKNRHRKYVNNSAEQSAKIVKNSSAPQADQPCPLPSKMCGTG
ncbi:hypothetical protein E2I14_13215 [Sapientia aquatica]|uniref:Uncharacterized protein n=1 Tax=Sapientia aquatica TaxID=1549640 RepID=A0A4R5W2R2_9BURK|nr:hypothetical protein E2I14_13215 [Sapientia aquatica]